MLGRRCPPRSGALCQAWASCRRRMVAGSGFLALACCCCNRHKGPNLSGMDPVTHRVARLFNPRSQIWEEHFSWHGPLLAGKTEVGRATVHALNVNRPDAVVVRELLLAEGVYPA